jgi:EAL domain-containing protein (putative c-di-GMP-specific phosphodiesterase class I)
MIESPGAMQDRLASHYLMDPASAARLRSTLTLAARTLGFPIAMINILDSDSQHTISAIGMALGILNPRVETFCDSVVRTGAPVVVRDAATANHFAELPSVRSGAVGAYLGVPLISRESAIVGSICMLDSTSRSVSADQVSSLVEFGKIVEDQLDLIRRLADQRDGRQSRTEELAAAIPAGQIVAWYQPVIDLQSERTVSYEALARWHHPSGIVEVPAYFVPLAEDSDLILELDRTILHQALRDLHRWQRSDPDARVSVNLSARHFDRDGWVASLAEMAQDAGVAPQSVLLELTETRRLSSSATADLLVAQLRAQGFGLLLDDFGTGWSSLEYLLRMPVHGLKIDRVMAAALGTAVGDAMIRVVTGLARELGLTTTIEGIETLEQAAAARRLGCDLGQGYLWSGAVPAATVQSMIDRSWAIRPRGAQ